MEKKGLVIFVIVGIVILLFWMSSPIEDKKPPIDPRANYWREIPIYYYFSEVYPCEDNRKTQVIEALNIIENETDKMVTFYEERNEQGIEISCNKEYETEESSAYGGIIIYEGETEILSGFVELYKPDPVNFEICESYPTAALHEILHAMGFDHIDSRKSVMNPVIKLGESCIEIDIEIVDCLKHIYSKGQGNYTCDDVPFMM